MFCDVKNKNYKIRVIQFIIIVLLLIAMPLALSAAKSKLIAKQYAQIEPEGVLPIYGIDASTLDNLVEGWTTAIKYGGPNAIDLFNKAPVYQGTNSIAYTVTAPGDELSLISPTSFDISPFEYLTFYAQAGSPGQRLGIFLIGQDGAALPAPANLVAMDSYGGLPAPGYWAVYNIPISAFNAADKNIRGIGFKDLNGGTQNIQPPPPIYIDEINFSVTQAADIPFPSGGVQISAPTAVPTPEKPYYPEISPWVFIIPGIIIALAVIFQ